MAQEEESGSRSIGNLTTRIVDMLENAASTPQSRPTPSAMSGTPRSASTPANSIGAQRGELGAGAKLPAVIAAALEARDPQATDRELRASLPPSVERSLTSIERNWDGPNGFEFKRLGWKLSQPVPVEDLEAAAALVAATLEPCPVPVLMRELARLRAATARRASSEDDEALAFAVLREELAAYPADVVRSALRNHARTNRFFPSLTELIAPCEEAVRERKMLHETLNAPSYAAALDSDKERLRQESLQRARALG